MWHKDQEIASLQYLVRQLQQSHQPSQQEIEMSIKQAIIRREEELRELIYEREEEVALATAQREQDIMGRYEIENSNSLMPGHKEGGQSQERSRGELEVD